MHNLRVPGCLLAALLLVVAAPQAQTPASVTESYTRARALLDAAVAAHGGVEALNAARQIRVTLDGHTFEARRGDSYCIPEGTKYQLEILEEATVVEATCPSDRGANTFDE